MEIRIKVPVFPTEEPEKVIIAVTNIFPDAMLIFEDEKMLVGTAKSLEHFATLIRNAKIRDTVRAELYRNLSGNKTHFRLNKQVAFAGSVSFSIGEPLGEIYVEIEDPELKKIIDEIAPDTRNYR
ncbi:MAG: RNA-binding domain-containing protein [Thermoplasmata archaeon]